MSNGNGYSKKEKINMHEFILILRTGLFILSFCGFYFWCGKNIKIHKAFYPALIFSSITLAIFIGGILNILNLMVYLVFFTGCILFFLHLDMIKKLTVSSDLLFLILFAGAFLILLKGQKLLHYDNFSHWGLVVRQILLTGRFPNFQDEIIIFQAYPLGSASFIYYVSRIISSSEGCWMFAQVLLIISMLTTLFAFQKKNAVMHFIVISLSTLFILGYNIPPQDLLVDTLLSIVGGAAYLLEWNCRKDYNHISYVAPLLCLLITIKNSAIFFVIIILADIILFALKNKEAMTADIIKKIILVCASPFAVLLIWNRHVNYVFQSGLTSKHSMSLENYASVFKQKDITQISDICHQFANRLLHENAFVYILIFSLLIMIAISMFNRNDKPILSSKLTAVHTILAYLFYQIGTLGMYIFSMPTYEASYLAAFDRYHKTIIVYLIMINLAGGCILINHIIIRESKNIRTLFAELLVAIVLIIEFISYSNTSEFILLQNQYTETPRYRLEKIISKYNIEKGRSYFICLSDDDRGYYKYLARYLMQSIQIKSIKVNNSQDIQDIANYDYIINFDYTNPILNNLPIDKSKTQLITIKK